MDRRVFFATACSLLLISATAPRPAAATAARIATINGQTTQWNLSLLRIRSMNRIPHSTWTGYNTAFKYRLFVLTVRLNNTGRRAANPYNDVTLTLKVLPNYPTAYPSGFTSVPHNADTADMYQAAARQYGGLLPWQATQPGRTSVYCYVIGANRGEAHYGLYSFASGKGMTFLQDTGF